MLELNSTIWNRISNVPQSYKLHATPEFRTDLLSSIAISGIPSTMNAQTPKEDLIGLLRLAAEVEHALMVQYLYSGLSLRRRDQRTINKVAIEEMGHLITVQNLLLAVNGVNDDSIPEPYFKRDLIRRSSDLNPIPFQLENVSRETLIKYIVVEMPHTIEDEALASKVHSLEKEIISIGIDPNPVYALYAAIRWIFQPDDSSGQDLGFSTELGFKSGWHLKPQDYAGNAVIEEYSSVIGEWNSYPGLIVKSVSNATEALEAIDAITEQGEGLPGSTDSHFHSFLTLFEKLESGRLRIKPLPRTPYVSTNTPPTEDDHPTPITNPYTQLWASLFNIQYEFMLLDLSWGFCQKRSSPKRTGLIDLTLENMRGIIKPLSSYLMKKKLGDDLPTLAAPTYELLGNGQPNSTSDYRTSYQELNNENVDIIAKIKSSSEFGMDTIGEMRIQDIENISQKRNPLIP